MPILSPEWRPGSTGQILSDLDLTSQKEGRWKRVNTLAHYNVSGCLTCQSQPEPIVCEHTGGLKMGSVANVHVCVSSCVCVSR